jgi:hypothetical protein
MCRRICSLAAFYSSRSFRNYIHEDINWAPHIDKPGKGRIVRLTDCPVLKGLCYEMNNFFEGLKNQISTFCAVLSHNLLVLTHYRGHHVLSPRPGPPPPLITEEVDRNKQCWSDSFINVYMQIQSSQSSQSTNVSISS